MLLDPHLTRSYYLTALTALRFLDERGGQRRFGLDADARWYDFAGDDLPEPHRSDARPRVLVEADRIDLLLRDADAQWPGAFGARSVFDLSDVAEDDAFGAEWAPNSDGTTLWHQIMLTPLISNLSPLITRCSAIWGLPLAIHHLPPLHPSTRWLLHGPSVIAAAISAFAASPAANWHQQVLVVAEPPIEPGITPEQQRQRAFARQLAALATGLLGQQQRTRLLSRPPTADEYPGYERLSSDAVEL